MDDPYWLQNEWIGIDSSKGWSSRFSVFFKSVPDTLKRELQWIPCFSLRQLHWVSGQQVLAAIQRNGFRIRR